MNWSELTPRQKDALVAEKVMGQGDQSMVRQMPDGTFQPIEGIWPLCPDYTTDIAAASLVENQLERDGVHLSYARYLAFLCGDPDHETREVELWALIRATPEQRCRAALCAKGVEV